MGQLLSVCMITKDEERNLPRALESVTQIAHEIILVDTGSSDRTIEIARSYGARVFEHPWCDDFAAARNQALGYATGDWILSLDADEQVSAAMARELPKALEDSKVDAYVTVLSNVGEETGRLPVVRLFRNRPHYRYRGRVHEQVFDSITGSGGKVLKIDMEILHYGYSKREDALKSRRSRNLKLIRLALEEDPGRAELWYHMAVEHLKRFEIQEAEGCLRKLLDLNPKDHSGAYAALSMAELQERRGEFAEAWSLAARCLNNPVGHWDGLMRIARIARAVGDYQTVLDCVAEVRKAPETDFGNTARNPEVLRDLEASALWEQGEHDQALDIWRAEARRTPGDLGASDRWVRHLARAKGTRRATVEAVREIPEPAVVAAAIGVLLRTGQLDMAAKMAERIQTVEIPSSYVLHGLARLGDWRRAERLALAHRSDGGIHLATAGICNNNSQAVSAALEHIPLPWRRVLTCLLEGQQVPSDHQWILHSLLGLWAGVGCYDMLGIATIYLEGTLSQKKAHVAKVLYTSGSARRGLEMALQYPEEADSLEVMGLWEYDHGDLERAGSLLLQRARLGPAPVRVYLKGSQALRKTNRGEEAGRLKAMGRATWPLAKIFMDRQI